MSIKVFSGILVFIGHVHARYSPDINSGELGSRYSELLNQKMIEADMVNDLLLCIEGETGDHAVPLNAGRLYTPTKADVITLGWLSNESVHDALGIITDIMIRAGYLLDPTLVIKNSSDYVSIICPSLRDSPGKDALVELLFSLFFAMARTLRSDFSAISVELTNPPPPLEFIDEYISYFGCPVLFGRKDNRINMKYNQFYLKNHNENNSNTVNDFDTLFMNYIGALYAPTFRSIVMDATRKLERKNAQSEQSSLAIHIGDIAEQLNMNVRTLQRKLHDEGTSFLSLLDNIREERNLIIKNRN